MDGCIWLPPSVIRYSQDSISPSFRNGVLLVEFFKKLLARELSPEDVETICCVWMWNEYYVSSGNRRLFVYKKLEELGELYEIQVQVWSNIPNYFWSMYTTKNDGMTIKCRRVPYLWNDLERIHQAFRRRKVINYGKENVRQYKKKRLLPAHSNAFNSREVTDPPSDVIHKPRSPLSTHDHNYGVGQVTYGLTREVNTRPILAQENPRNSVGITRNQNDNTVTVQRRSFSTHGAVIPLDSGTEATHSDRNSYRIPDTTQLSQNTSTGEINKPRRVDHTSTDVSRNSDIALPIAATLDEIMLDMGEKALDVNIIKTKVDDKGSSSADQEKHTESIKTNENSRIGKSSQNEEDTPRMCGCCIIL